MDLTKKNTVVSSDKYGFPIEDRFVWFIEIHV